MRSFLLALSIVTIFTACQSNHKSQNLTGTEASMSFPDNHVSDSSAGKVTPQGAKRVVVVETHNADGSSTITTTTEANTTATSHADTLNAVTKPTVATATPVSTGSTEKQKAHKKGWSNRAKGAAIGGVGGAAVGPVISKKKLKGALIGGVAGAAGGYIIGNETGKKRNN